VKIRDCSCGKRIFFAVNKKTRNVEPIEAEPREDGNIEICGTGESKQGTSMPVVRHLAKGEVPLFRNGDRFISHFAECPHADRYRRS
jgi:hypothetical protein